MRVKQIAEPPVNASTLAQLLAVDLTDSHIRLPTRRGDDPEGRDDQVSD
jgi:hypothetical protein